MVIEFHHCWGWLIEERVDIFVIEKYIEINKGIGIMYKFLLIQTLTLLVLQYNGIIGSMFIDSKKTLPKKLTL